MKETEMQDFKGNQVSMLNESQIQVIQISKPHPTSAQRKRKQFKRGTTILNAGKQLSTFEDSRITMMLFEKYKIIELVRLMMICGCTALTILEYEYSFASQLTRDLDSEMELILYLILIMSIIIFLMTIVSFLVFLSYQKSALQVTHDANIFETKLIWNLLIELLIIIPTSTPFTRDIKVFFTQRYVPDIERFYYMNEILTYCMIIRSVIVGNILLKFYPLYNSQVSRVCRVYSADFGTHFTLKLAIRDKPFTTIAIMFVLGMFACGYTLEISERALLRTVEGYDPYYIQNSYWVNMITIGTIGYGDLFPYTELGRFSMFIGVFYGVTCTSLFTAMLYLELLPSQGEMLAWAVLEKAIVTKRMKRVARGLLVDLFRVEKAAQVGNENMLKTQVSQLEDLMQTISYHKREYKDIDGEEFMSKLKRGFKDTKTWFEDYIKQLKEFKEQQRNILRAVAKPMEFSFKSNQISGAKSTTENRTKSQNPTGSANTYERQSKDELFFQNLEDMDNDPYLMHFED